MALDIDELQIEIEASSDQAEKKLDRLIAVIDKLQAATERCTGLTKLRSQIQKLSETTEKISSLNAGSDKIKNFVSSINGLNDINTPNLTKLRNQMDKLNQISDNLSSMPDIADNVSCFVNAIKPFESMGKSNINSYINSLKKLPEITEQLNGTDLDGFSRSLSKVTSAITPLANAMERLGNGYSALPTNIKQVVSSNNQLEISSKRVEKTQTSLSSIIGKTKMRMLAMFYAANRVADSLSECLNSSNEYIENLNLFTVAMGDGAQAALDYAETVNDALGIDVSEWIRNQGTFKQITTGFGVVEDKANLMSKNLTQLGYDISSFFNIDIEESMQKLQSGISGEIEPLRRLGYAIDAATLQQVAYDHGILQNINTMTQAQKSQLRYLAIMEQSGNAMGDMARTIITPSNSMRILNQQFEQLKRAIGNVVSVFAVKLIPYIQVAVRLLTDLVNALAKKWGFELPEIDYGDGLSGITDEMSDLTDNAESAGESISEMAREVQRLAGFDELNILSSDKFDVDTGADKAKDELAEINDWQLALPEYDFLEGLNKQTDELYKKAKKKIDDIINKFKDLKKWIEKNKATVEKFGKALLGIWAVKKVNDFIKALSGVDILKSAVSWASDFFKFFKQSEATTFFGKFKDGAKNARDQMTPLTKLVGTLVGTVTAGFGSYNLFKDLTAGTLTWKGALADSALIVGGLATSWIFGGLPGLGVAAVAAAFAGLAGYIKECDERASALAKELVDSELYGNGGVKVSELAKAYEELYSGLKDSLQPLLDTQAAIDENKQKIDDNLDVIDTYVGKIQEGKKLSGGEIKEMKGQFDDLIKNMKNNLEFETGLVFDSFVLASENASEDLGLNIQDMEGILDEFKQKYSSKVDELNDENEIYFEKLLSGQELTNEEQQKFLDNIYYATDLNKELSDAQFNLDETVKSLAKVDFENQETVLEKIDEIKGYTSDLLAEVDEVSYNAQKTLAEFKRKARVMYEHGDISEAYYKETVKMFNSMGESIQKGYDEKKDSIKGDFEAVMGAIYNQALEAVDNAASKIDPNEHFNVLDKVQIGAATLVYGYDSTSPQVRDQIYEDVRKDYEWLFSAVEDAGKEFDASYNLTTGKELLETIVSGAEDFLPSAKKRFTAATKSVLDLSKEDFHLAPSQEEWEKNRDKYQQGGIKAAQGYGDGISGRLTYVVQQMGFQSELLITQSLDRAAEKATVATTDILKTMSDSLSLDLTGNGKNIGKSFSNGLSEGLKGVVDSCNSTLWRFELFEIEMMNAFNDAVPAFQQMANGISTVVGMGLGNIDFINYTSRGRQIPGYATGGYPRRADLFYANENGVPEMVGRIGARTAVANTDQITTAIAAAVRAAIRESGGMQSGNSSKQQGDTYIFLDSDEISYRIECRNAAKAKMTGGIK